MNQGCSIGYKADYLPVAIYSRPKLSYWVQRSNSPWRAGSRKRPECFALAGRLRDPARRTV